MHHGAACRLPIIDALGGLEGCLSGGLLELNPTIGPGQPPLSPLPCDTMLGQLHLHFPSLRAYPPNLETPPPWYYGNYFVFDRFIDVEVKVPVLPPASGCCDDALNHGRYCHEL